MNGVEHRLHRLLLLFVFVLSGHVSHVCQCALLAVSQALLLLHDLCNRFCDNFQQIQSWISTVLGIEFDVNYCLVSQAEN